MEQLTTEGLAEILWDYLQMWQSPEKADIIMVLGSNDTRVAEYAAKLYNEGYASRIIFTGNVGILTKGKFTKTEAETFADTAEANGVPREVMLLETASTNTGENVRFSREVLEKEGIEVTKLLVVTKPYMERRAYACFMKQWEGKELIMASPRLTWREYPNSELGEDVIIPILVGDLQRIKVYPEKGFQIHQEIPENVWSAYEELIRRGYTSHLLQQ